MSDELPIHAAAIDGDLDALENELSKGVSIDAASEETFTAGDTPLSLAAAAGQVKALQFLLERKASLESVNKHGQSALHQACVNKEVGTANLLLDCKAQIDKCCSHNWTPLMYACHNGADACVKVLLERKADTTIKASGGIVQADSIVDAVGRTALEISTLRKQDSIVALLRSATSAPAASAASTASSPSDGITS